MSCPSRGRAASAGALRSRHSPPFGGGSTGHAAARPHGERPQWTCGVVRCRSPGEARACSFARSIVSGWRHELSRWAAELQRFAGNDSSMHSEGSGFSLADLDREKVTRATT